MKRREKLEKQGYSFTWAYSVYRVCVCYKNRWIGTFATQRAYGIPSDDVLRDAIRGL